MNRVKKFKWIFLLIFSFIYSASARIRHHTDYPDKNIMAVFVFNDNDDKAVKNISQYIAPFYEQELHQTSQSAIRSVLRISFPDCRKKADDKQFFFFMNNKAVKTYFKKCNDKFSVMTKQLNELVQLFAQSNSIKCQYAPSCNLHSLENDIGKLRQHKVQLYIDMRNEENKREDISHQIMTLNELSSDHPKIKNKLNELIRNIREYVENDSFNGLKNYIKEKYSKNEQNVSLLNFILTYIDQFITHNDLDRDKILASLDQLAALDSDEVMSQFSQILTSYEKDVHDRLSNLKFQIEIMEEQIMMQSDRIQMKKSTLTRLGEELGFRNPKDFYKLPPLDLCFYFEFIETSSYTDLFCIDNLIRTNPTILWKKNKYNIKYHLVQGDAQ